MSLLELFAHLEREIKVKLHPISLPWRANDQKYFVADNTKATNVIDWKPKTGKDKGIADAIAWEKSRRSLP